MDLRFDWDQPIALAMARGLHWIEVGETVAPRSPVNLHPGKTAAETGRAKRAALIGDDQRKPKETSQRGSRAPAPAFVQAKAADNTATAWQITVSADRRLRGLRANRKTNVARTKHRRRGNHGLPRLRGGAGA